MKMYKAIYADEDVMEIIHAETNDEAMREAWGYEIEHGTLFNLYLIDDDYNEIETII